LDPAEVERLYAQAAAAKERLAVVGEQPTAAPIRELAADLLCGKRRLTALEKQIATLVATHPDGALVRSLPDMGAELSAEFLAAAGITRRFASADALAAASGLAPVLTQSGKVRYTRGATGGDNTLKRAFYQSAFCAIKHDPTSLAYHDRKRTEGKRHHQALIALARCRINVLYTILRDRRPYQTRPHLTQLAA
jgi:transposase